MVLKRKKPPGMIPSGFCFWHQRNVSNAIGEVLETCPHPVVAGNWNKRGDSNSALTGSQPARSLPSSIACMVPKGAADAPYSAYEAELLSGGIGLLAAAPRVELGWQDSKPRFLAGGAASNGRAYGCCPRFPALKEQAS